MNYSNNGEPIPVTFESMEIEKDISEILLLLLHEITCLSKLVEPLEDQVQKYGSLRDRILKLRDVFNE